MKTLNLYFSLNHFDCFFITNFKLVKLFATLIIIYFIIEVQNLDNYFSIKEIDLHFFTFNLIFKNLFSLIIYKFLIAN